MKSVASAGGVSPTTGGVAVGLAGIGLTMALAAARLAAMVVTSSAVPGLPSGPVSLIVGWVP